MISGLINLINLLLLPSDQKTALLFGYSSKRLAIIAVLFIGITIFVIALIKLIKSPPKTLFTITSYLKKQSFLAFLIVFFFLSIFLVWIAGFSTEHFLGNATYFAMSKRLLPLCIWLLSVSVIAIGVSVLLQNNDLMKTPIADKENWRLIIITFVIMVLFFLFTAWIFPQLSEQLWWSSVPILITQIFVAWILANLIMLIPGRFYSEIPGFIRTHADLLIFILIWIISAVLWVNQPFDPNSEEFSLTPQQQQFIFPRRPNYELYPRFDSETYFQVSESIVTGGGIYRSIDKPLFLAIEGFFNWIAGGSFEKMLNLQTILLASFPAVVYLLGSKLHSRIAGLFTASLSILQGINGIRLMATTSVLLSEPFMQLWTAIIALSAFLAFKDPGKHRVSRFIFLGGMLGLSALVRLNTVVIVPFILLIILIFYFRERKKFYLTAGVFFIGILLAFSPWVTLNSIKFHDPFAFILDKVRGVIVNKRYEKISSTLDLIEVNKEDTGTQDFEIPDENIPNNTPTIKPSIPITIFRHFLNNIITSVSTLPGSGIPQDLVKGSRNQRYWAGYDTTLYKGISPAFFVFNLLILSIGSSSIIKKHKVVGFIPAAIFFGYHLSNGIAVSSGHRYAQPVSWIVFFYYAIGLISISRVLFTLLKIDTHVSTPKFEKKGIKRGGRTEIIATGFCILLLGSTPVIADLLPINRYTEISGQELFTAVNNEENLRFSGENGHIEDFFNAVENNDLDIVYGRILTPIFVNNEKFVSFYGKENLGGEGTYLAFNVLGPESRHFKRMFFYPQSDLVEIKNGMDAIIFLDGESDIKMAIGIGIIDPAFSSKISSYKNISQIPFKKFFPSIDYLKLIGSVSK